MNKDELIKKIVEVANGELTKWQELEKLLVEELKASNLIIANAPIGTQIKVTSNSDAVEKTLDPVVTGNWHPCGSLSPGSYTITLTIPKNSSKVEPGERVFNVNLLQAPHTLIEISKKSSDDEVHTESNLVLSQAPVGTIIKVISQSSKSEVELDPIGTLKPKSYSLPVGNYEIILDIPKNKKRFEAGVRIFQLELQDDTEITITISKKSKNDRLKSKPKMSFEKYRKKVRSPEWYEKSPDSLAGLERIRRVYAPVVWPNDETTQDSYPEKPWSAIFVSYVISTAADKLGVFPPLAKKASHFGYAKAAFGEERIGMYHALTIQDAGELQLGDIIIAQRTENKGQLKNKKNELVQDVDEEGEPIFIDKKKTKPKYLVGNSYQFDLTYDKLKTLENAQSHGDIVTGISDNLTVIGGNVSDSVKDKKVPKQLDVQCLHSNNWEPDSTSKPFPRFNCPTKEEWENASKDKPAIVVNCPQREQCRYFAVLRIVGDVKGEAKTGIGGSDNVITLTKEQQADLATKSKAIDFNFTDSALDMPLDDKIGDSDKIGDVPSEE